MLLLNSFRFLQLAADYASTVLTDEPIAYFRMAETSGTSATNLGSNGIAGTYTNPMLNQVGFVENGKSVQFAATGKLDMNFNTSYSAVSVEFFFVASATNTSGQPTLIGKNSYFAQNENDWPFAVFWDAPNKKVKFNLSAGGDFTVDASISSTVLTPGQYYHVVIVYQANTKMEIWIDGVLNASGSIAFAASTGNSRDWSIGGADLELGGGVGQSGFAGRIAEVAFYNKVLTSDRIIAHNALRKALTTPTPAFSNVLLLLSGDGANDSTVFTDESSFANTMNGNGNAKISTTQQKFGGSSIFLDGTGDYIKAATPSNFYIGTGDFTVEGFFYPTTIDTGVRPLFSISENLIADFKYWYIGINSNGAVFASITESSSTQIASAAGLVTTGNWYHIAVSRQGTTLKIFLDGIEVASGSTWINFSNSYALHVSIGAIGNAYTDASMKMFAGYIDEFRICDEYLYSQNFIPPAAPYPTS